MEGQISDLKRVKVSYDKLFDTNELYESFQKVNRELQQQVALMKRELTQQRNSEFLDKMK